jgi:hypothetical protein
MARINVVHAGAAGVVAGVVINLTARAAWSFVLPSRMMAGSYLWGFAVGMTTVWLYSVMSARSGPSPGRAVVAGMIAWLFTIAVPNYGFWVFETLSGSLLALSSVLGIVEIIPAALGGAWVYEWAAATKVARAAKQQTRNASTVRLTPHTPLSVEAI